MTPSAQLARMLVDALTRAGVTHVVLCPGSRSAPLAYALAEHAPSSLTTLVRHDERAAAFTALGVSRSGNGLGAVVTTSGTAVANLHPAVLEASHANVPLIVVSADRPPPLRGTWANQTSEFQRTLFGDAVRSSLDLDDGQADAAPDVAWQALLATLQTGLGVVAEERPGPVHLNLGFADPLTPEPDEPDGLDGLDTGDAGDRAVEPTAGSPAQPGEEERRPGVVVRRRRQEPSDDVLEPGPRTVVVAGDGAGWQARWLAEAAGWPLLAEPSSGARGGPNAVSGYRLLLPLPGLGEAVERVVVFGRPTLSRPVMALLGRPEVEVVLASRYPQWPVAGRPVIRVSHNVSPAGLAELGRGWYLADPDEWLDRWRAAGLAAQHALDDELTDRLGTDGPARLNGPAVASCVWDAVGEAEPLVVGASNAIRDLDLVARPRDVPGAESVGTGWLVIANRGLAGIDGTVSTATGVALAAGRRTRLLLGDLTFLHDLTGVIGEPGAARPDLQVVVVNDEGGGVFSLLEHGERAEESPARARTFERMFGTPHEVDLAALCAGLGVPHRKVEDGAELRAVLAAPEPGTAVVEVPADRAGLRTLHRRLASAVRRGVGA